MLRHLAAWLPLALAAALMACRNQQGGAPERAPQPAAGEQTTAAAQPRAQARSPATRPTSFTGTLRGGMVAIGGETTGWRLIGDGQTGGIDVDVSKIEQRAKALDGKRVTVTGKMTTRGYPERGRVQVLVAERIEEERAANNQ